jgi:serine/threonine-protein kinase
MAVVLWECIAGRRLFRGEEAVETLQEVMTGPIPSLRKIGAPVSAAVDEAILRGLSRDLDERFGSAVEFADTLREAAGREGTASPAEVAALVEALFGDRLRVRHELIREVLDAEDMVKVFEFSGLSPRPSPSAEMVAASRKNLESLAPPAPGDRYAFGGSDKHYGIFAGPRLRLVVAAVAGLALAGLVILIVAKTRTPASAPAQAEPANRRVVVPLPFVATRVTFDDESRELSPPSDVVAFEVPREAGLRHRVTAVAFDGARAEAYVREDNGVARPEDPAGYSIEAFEAMEDDPDAGVAEPSAKRGAPKPIRRLKQRPRAPVAPPPPAPAASAAPPSGPKPVGTVKDGFTKLQ